MPIFNGQINTCFRVVYIYVGAQHLHGADQVVNLRLPRGSLGHKILAVFSLGQRRKVFVDGGDGFK